MKQMSLAVLLGFMTAVLPAAEKRPFAIDDLYRLKGIAGLALSPAGDRLVFEVSSQELKKAERNTDLYELHLATGKVRQLTTQPGSESSACWSPDGRTLYFEIGRAHV